jgi:Ala-tRNA(Pro) deacylase
MNCRARLEAYLREQRVPFAAQQHRIAYTAQDVAAAEHIPNQIMAKVVIVSADGALVMLVLPTTHRVDLRRIRASLGARELYLVGEQEFAAAFPDCEIGAMPPFGNLYHIPVYVDRRLAEDEMIVFQAGTHTETIRMRYADYARLVQPTTIAFARYRREMGERSSHAPDPYHPDRTPFL